MTGAAKGSLLWAAAGGVYGAHLHWTMLGEPERVLRTRRGDTTTAGALLAQPGFLATLYGLSVLAWPALLVVELLPARRPAP